MVLHLNVVITRLEYQLVGTRSEKTRDFFFMYSVEI